MSELKQQLEALGDEGASRGAVQVMRGARAAAPDAGTGERSGGRRSGSRRVLVVGAAIVTVAAIVGGVLVWRHDAVEPVRGVRIVPAPPGLDDLFDTSGQTPLGTPLYLVPAYVPAGMEPFLIAGGDHPGEPQGSAGSDEVTRWQRWIKFDAAGTRPVAEFSVQWGTGPTVDAPLAGFSGEPEPDPVRGHEAVYWDGDGDSGNGLVWEEPPGHNVLVSSDLRSNVPLTRAELHAIADGLLARPDGGFDVTNAPADFIKVAEAPGMASIGTNPRSLVYRGADGRAFLIRIVDGGEWPPGQNLFPGGFSAMPCGPESDPHLVEVRGAHAVAARWLNGGGGSLQQGMFSVIAADRFVQWLEPANVLVTISGVGLSEDEILDIARGLDVVDAATWASMLRQPPADQLPEIVDPRDRSCSDVVGGDGTQPDGPPATTP